MDGIDLLKMIAMFMVVVGHMLVHGGLLNAVVPYSSQYWAVWFMEVVVYCAVDCFALSTGYLMSNSSTKLSRLLELWFQVVFYSLLIAIFMAWKFADVRDSITIINILFPITYKEYWYLTAYFGMYFLIPIFNAALNGLEQKRMGQVLLYIGLFFIIAPTITNQDPYNANQGYSMIWLCVLYLIGGYIAKYPVFENTKRKTLFMGFIISTLTTFFCILSSALCRIPSDGYILVSYTSPTVVLAAIFLFLFCKGMQFHGYVRHLCSLYGGGVIGILIISDNNLIRNKLISGCVAELYNKSVGVMSASVLLISLMIYLICFGIDMIRRRLFKYLHVKEICEQLEFWVYSVYERDKK